MTSVFKLSAPKQEEPAGVKVTEGDGGQAGARQNVSKSKGLCLFFCNYWIFLIRNVKNKEKCEFFRGNHVQESDYFNVLPLFLF